MRHTIMILGMAMTTALGACGGGDSGGDSGGGDNLGRFVGTWQPVSGTVTTTCSGYEPSTDPIVANVIWSRGVGADLVSTDVSTSCATMADVAGSTASGLPGQTCSFPDGQGGTYTFTLSGYTFVLAPDARTATENASGQASYVGGGQSVICTLNATASYQKIGN